MNTNNFSRSNLKSKTLKLMLVLGLVLSVTGMATSQVAFNQDEVINPDGETIRDTAISGDSSLFGVASQSDDVYIYDTDTYTEQEVLTENNDLPYNANFHKNDELFVVGGKNEELIVYDTTDWSVETTLTDATDFISESAYTENNLFVATDGEILVYDTTDWSLETTLDGEADLSLNNDFLAVPTSDDTVKIYDSDTLSLEEELTDFTNTPDNVELLEGKLVTGTLGTASGDPDYFIYDTSDWSIIDSEEKGVDDIAGDPEGEFYGVVIDDIVEIQDSSDNNINTISDASSTIATLDWADENDYLSYGSFDENAYIYQILQLDAVLNTPENNSVVDINNDVEFDFDVSTAEEDTDIDLVLVDGQGSESTIFSTTQSDAGEGSYTHNESLTEDSYSYYVELNDGEFTSDSFDFEAVDYASPVFNLNSPVDETITSYSSSNGVDFDFDINEADIGGDYSIDIKNSSSTEYETVSTGTFEEGDNTITDSVNIDFPSSGTEEIDWRVTTTDELGDSQSSSNSFTVERLEEPEITIERPEDEELFYVEEGGNIQIPFEGWINNSQESGEAFAQAFDSESLEFEDSIGEINEGDNFVEGDLLVVEGDYSNAKIRADFDSGSSFESNAISFNVERGNPEITDFTVESSDVEDLEDAQPGDQFDVSVEGDVNENEIEEVFYAVGVSDQEDPESINREPEFQDQNSFSDSEDDAFTMEEEWQGETLTFQVQVADTEDQVDSESQVVETATPPEDFIYNSPDDDEVFLIPDGETDVEVDFDYGVEASNFDGTAELVLEGETEDSFSVDADSTGTNQFSRDLGDGEYEWFVRWNDTNGDSYSGGSREFQISDEPIALSLQSPRNDEEILIDEGDTTSIDHDFKIDARALDGDYYYDFTVYNDSDNGEEILDRTSNDQSGGTTDTYTETIDSLNPSNYTWTVEVYDASDDTQLESSETSYEVIGNPEFESELVRPVDNEVFYLNGSSQRDVEATYNVESFYQTVDTELVLDGNDIDTRTISSDSDETVNVNMEDLEADTYNLTFSAEDESGRVQEQTSEFEVQEKENEDDVEITSLRFEPDLEDASVGEELDIYIEGTGTPEDVDFVEFEITADGEVIDTVIVPSEDLTEGSWFYTAENSLTATSDLIGSAIDLNAQVHDTAGNIFTSTVSGILGADRQLSVGLNDPTDGRTFEQVENESEDIRFDFDVTTADTPVEWDLVVRNETSDYEFIGNGEIDETDTTENVEVFRNMETELFVQQQFGEFTWKVEAEDENGETFTTPSRSFEIVEESDEPILNFNEPSDGENFYLNGDETVDVPFQFDVDTTETGEFTLEIEDETGTTEIDIPRNDIDEGFSQRSVTDEFDEGFYTANLRFDSDSYSAEESTTFSVREQEIDEEDAEIRLEEPADDRTLYQNFGNPFSWSVYNPASNESGEGNSTLYIEDSDGDVVETFERDYDTQNERRTYRELWDTQTPQGQYTFYAEFDGENLDDTITTEERSFDVTDFTKPRSDLINPIDDVYTTSEDIGFEWETESFEENVDSLELRVRRNGEYGSELVENVSGQDSNTVSEYDVSESAGEIGTGKWEYFIRMNVDDASFDSPTENFTVEQTDIPDPDFNLISPEQGEEYEIDGSETVDVEFEFITEIFSETDSEIELLLEAVEDGSGQGYETVYDSTASNEDGETSYNHTEALGENGYRWKVKITDPNDEEFESDARSFAVGEADVPEPVEESTSSGRISEFLEGIWNYYDEALNGMGGLVAGLLIIIATVGLTAMFGANAKTLEIVAVSSIAFNGLVNLWPRGVIFALIVIAGAVIYFKVRGD